MVTKEAPATKIYVEYRIRNGSQAVGNGEPEIKSVVEPVGSRDIATATVGMPKPCLGFRFFDVPEGKAEGENVSPWYPIVEVPIKLSIR